MKHQLLIFASIGIIVFFALLNIDIPALSGHSLTGQVVEEPEAYPVTLNDVVKDFFVVSYVDFPSGGCGDVAAGLYENIFMRSLDATTGFATTGVDRLATINFVRLPGSFHYWNCCCRDYFSYSSS
ncbi:MAG: hypothetical protein NTW67_01220 [Candidatus Woesearchaeota archaeon]|nr:hypothetical protein [Candidatus Woesearchaeota archaeon]